jgi:hypothetical protein
MKIIRFKTSFNDTLEGCMNEVNKLKVAYIEIPAPDNIDELEADGYKLTTYIEKLTNCFVFEQEVINKPVTTTNEQPRGLLKTVDELFDKYIMYAPQAQLKHGADILEFKKEVLRLIV